ncbi:MAG: putative Methyltransferase [Myxococcaceae bacterium]|nr:putative Methyltransferase [Myxococcaceae bacterium]
MAEPSYQQVVDAPDRDPADRSLDQGRKPAELLAFIGVRRGMRVADIGAAGGYTAELLARVVTPSGRVYLQNSPFLLARFAEKPLTERLQKPVMKDAVRLDRDFDDPFPGDLQGLDIVSDILFYHDTVWMNVDRARMNKAIFDALKPGGLYVVVDHSSAVGKGISEVESLHRIEESVVKAEIEAAGFSLVESADFLRSKDDTRDWSASPRFAGERRGSSDRFVLKFRKP